MAISSKFGTSAGNATVSGTLDVKDPVMPVAPPDGLQAIGPRVTFHFTGLWDKNTDYVYYDVCKDGSDNSYIAIKPKVPAGTALTDSEYWFKWADPNQQIYDLGQVVETYKADIDKNTNNVATLTDQMAAKTDSGLRTLINTDIDAIHEMINTDIDAIHEMIKDDETLISNNTQNITKNATKINNMTHFFNVLDYGAIGDGVNDDTNAIKAAIAAAQNSVNNTPMFENDINQIKATVYFPKGTYLIQDTININANATITTTSESSYVSINIKGEGSNSSIINFNNNAGFVFAGGYQTTEDISIVNCDIALHYKGNSYTPYVNVRNCTFKNCNGIYFETGTYVTNITNCLFINAIDYGIQAGRDGTSLNISNCYVTGTPSIAGYNIAGYIYSQMVNCQCDTSNTAYRFYKDTSAQKASITMLNCGSESVGKYFVEIKDIANSSFTLINFNFVNPKTNDYIYFNNTHNNSVKIINPMFVNASAYTETLITNNTKIVSMSNHIEIIGSIGKRFVYTPCFFSPQIGYFSKIPSTPTTIGYVGFTHVASTNSFEVEVQFHGASLSTYAAYKIKVQKGVLTQETIVSDAGIGNLTFTFSPTDNQLMVASSGTANDVNVTLIPKGLYTQFASLNL